MQARFHVLFCLIGKLVSYHTKKHVYVHVFFIQKSRRTGMEEYKVIDHYLMIRLPEEIDHNSCKNISRRADHMLLDSEVSHVVFDFSDTKFMDSSGIGVLVGRYRKISCFGGKVYVIHADSRILRILRMSGLEKIVEIME